MTDQLTTNLYINPSYITARYDIARKPRTELQRATRAINFKSNHHRGKVSKNSQKKIRIAIQWLVLLAEKKKVYDRSSGKFIEYKAGLATVSLPTGCNQVDERFFRDTLLTSILDAMNYQFGLKNYLWKIERQKNGTLHAHITLDKFIPHEWLLAKWCTILDKHGLLEEYRSKFSAMGRNNYVHYRMATDNQGYKGNFKSHLQYIKALVRAYAKGKRMNWSRPNCTDIHAVKNVRYLASYMVKYMSKDPNLGESFKGRYWACSHSLSKLRTIHVALPEQDIIQFSKFIEPACRGSEELYYFRKLDGEPVFMGVIYFLARSLGKLYKNSFLSQLFGTLKTLYHASNLEQLPYMALMKSDHLNFKLQKTYEYAS